MLDSRGSFRPTKLFVAVSLCCASVLTLPAPAAAACQAGDAGCVLPVGRTAPAPPAPATTETTTATTPMYEEEGGGISWVLIALGLAAIAAAIFLLVNDDDDEPVSP